MTVTRGGVTVRKPALPRTGQRGFLDLIPWSDVNSPLVVRLIVCGTTGMTLYAS